MAKGDAASFKAIFLAVFIFVDLILFLVPFLMTVSRRKKLREYTITSEATVIEVSSERQGTHYGAGSTGAPMWYPTYQYTVGGQVFTHKSRVGTSEKLFEVGDRIKILVDPNNYEKFVLPDSKGFKIATGILWTLFALFLVGIICVAVFI